MPAPILKRLFASTVAVCGLMAAIAWAAPSLAAAQSALVSGNWSGYAVTGPTAGSHFNRVAGTWVQPQGTCARHKETYSVTWVGLGGFNQGSKALEQTGTAVNCSASGHAIYSAWFELVPAAQVKMKLAIHPGDRIAASVAQKEGKTILQVRDLSTHLARTVVQKLSKPDLTSAEWIVEAPSLCFSATNCTPLPLTNFGTVSFSNASVSTAKAQRAAIDSASLHVTRLDLRDYSQGSGQRFSSAMTPATGIASPLSATGKAFTVTWQALREGEPSEEAPSQGPPAPPPGLTSAAASIRR